MRYRAKGTVKNRIWLVPDTIPRLTPSTSPSARISESSVNIVVVMGTTRNE